MPWALVVAVTAVAGLAGWVVYGTSALGVREVRVTGTSVLTATQVRQAADVPEDTPLARVDLADVRERVAALAPVARATVSRDWPGTLVVAVTERTAVAAVPRDDEFVLVDRAGVAFHTVASQPSGLPAVRVKSIADAATAVQVLTALTPQLRDALVAVKVDSPVRIRLVLTGDREVVWGDATRGDRKAQMATVLLSREDSLTGPGRASGGRTFDVSAPEVVTIR